MVTAHKYVYFLILLIKDKLETSERLQTQLKYNQNTSSAAKLIRLKLIFVLNISEETEVVLPLKQYQHFFK